MGAFQDALNNATTATSSLYGDATQKASNMWGNMKGFFGEQRGDTQDYLGRYTGAIKGQEPLQAMYARVGREVGLPQLQQTATQVNQTNANIPSVYSGATRGFDVNANQLARTIGTKQAEYAPVVQNANQAVNNAMTNVNQQMGYEQAQQAKSLLPYQAEGSFLNDRLARESSGFTTSAQAELQTYIQKAQSGIQLTDSELQRANQIALQKMQNDAEMARLDKQLNMQKYQIDNDLSGLAKMFMS
jgi:hypothetical protein